MSDTLASNDAAPGLTAIQAIQGAGDASPLAGQAVTARGVVTAVRPGSSGGFYIQDPDGDGDAATSDAVFVFTGAAPGVAIGDVVDVSGTVVEFTPRGAAPGTLSLTEIASVTGTAVISSGNKLPAAAVIGTGGVQPPTADLAAGTAFYERLEGMLATVEDPLVTGPTNGFGEIETVASGGAEATGLNARGDLLISGGKPSFGATDAVGGDFNPERIQIDDSLGVAMPDASVGARLQTITGVIDYAFGNYELLAKTDPVIAEPSPLTKDAATLTGDAGHLLVGSYNAENLDPGDGADRFAAIADEIIGKLNSPDVIALQEVQDDTGPANNGVTSASRTLQALVNAVHAAGGPQYGFIDNPFIGDGTNGGQPGGNIRTAFLYRADRVEFIDGSLATVAADGSALAAPDAEQQTKPSNPFYDSRPPLAAAFRFNGQDVTVVNNHFTSKGGSGPLFGSVQPPSDGGEVQRAAQAQAVNSYVDGLLAADPGARVIVAGDLNEFGFEQPISVVRGAATISDYAVPGDDPYDATATYTPGGAPTLTDLEATLPEGQRFDYVFEGNAQTLDHMLVTDALAAGAAFQPVHINSEFFDQTSDHDPLVGRFVIPAPAGGGASPGESTPMNPLKIVLLNDDGFTAPGITTLYQALVSAGFDVQIVAPAENQSAQGSSFGGPDAVANPIAIEEVSPGNYSVDGRPAVATLAALDVLFAGQQPDLVISGTNRGENIGESENISGTVNGALQGLFQGVPSIAVSAGSFDRSYDGAFGAAANFTVDFLQQLQDARADGQPILPNGEGLTINVPGNPALEGIAVTTVTNESSASFPFSLQEDGAWAEDFIPNTSPSGSPTAEGSRFLQNYVTVSPIDGNWGATEADRAALQVRLGDALTGNPPPPAGPLNILLLNEDGYGAPGINATRDALLAQGYDVTVLAPATDQSGVGSALFLDPVTVTQYDASNFSANGTPGTLVALGFDPEGLFGGVRPDLLVVGADQGSAVGVENANHSATLAAAVTALFNYGVPSIALSSASGAEADLAASAQFLTTLIANLQATQGDAASILPGGVGLNVNVPAGADVSDYAFTNIDQATDGAVALEGNATEANFVTGAPASSGNPYSEGDAFNAGSITISPIDGNIATRDPGAYAQLAQLLGTTYGTPTAKPSTLTFDVSQDAYQGDATFTVSVNGEQIGGAQTVTASHAAGETQTVTVYDFFDPDIQSVGIAFNNDLYGGTPATDRNLYVDRLTLNGQTYEAESATSLSGAGALLPAEAVLYGNGTLSFTTTQDTLSFRVSGDAYDGEPQFNARVNGAQVGGTQTVTASHADGQYQDITLSGDFGDVTSVALDFINDLYAGTPETDRNLYVDSLTLNGTVYEAEQAVNAAGPALQTEAALYSNGALTFDLTA